MYIERSPHWRATKNTRTIEKQCARCHNHAEFRLVYDYATSYLAGLIRFKAYALKCPICIHYELVRSDVAKSFFK